LLPELTAERPIAEGVFGAISTENMFEFLNAEIIDAVVLHAENRDGTCYAVSLVHHDFRFRDAGCVSCR